MDDVIFFGISGLVITLVFTILLLLWYSGLFTTVEIGSGKSHVGRLQIAYKFATGPYKDCGSLFTEICNTAPKLRTCGIYYDDPNEVEHSKLRYIVAAVLAEDDGKVDENVEKILLDKGYKLFEVPAIEYAVKTSFPYVWDLSIHIAMMKVYPKMGKYVEERRLSAHPAVEIYESTRIHFLMPLSKQELFYVPEASYGGGDEEEKSADETGNKTREEDTLEDVPDVPSEDVPQESERRPDTVQGEDKEGSGTDTVEGEGKEESGKQIRKEESGEESGSSFEKL